MVTKGWDDTMNDIPLKQGYGQDSNQSGTSSESAL